MTMVHFVRSLAGVVSIMTGDDSSPTLNRKEEFNFGRSTPPPTTSYHSHSVKVDHDIKTHAEPNKEDKEKEKDDKDEIDVLRPNTSPDYKPNEKKEEDKESKRDNGGDKDKGPDKDMNSSEKKCNGDSLDGQWIPASDAKVPPNDEEEDDNCAVKCLYYSMQICECTVL